jgi:hypothetical protein
MYEQPYRHYWRVLYPEYAEPKSTAHWYGKWKTGEMCMGLFGERQQARHEWIAKPQASHRKLLSDSPSCEDGQPVTDDDRL